MKKRCIILVLILTMLLSVIPVSAENNEVSITMAINQSTAVVDGTQRTVTAPILVLDRTYVDLYDVAGLLGYKIEWVEAYIGYFKVYANNNIVDFTLISNWSELSTEKYKFFIKDAKVFVALREIVDLYGLDISYNKGVINIGKINRNTDNIFGGIMVYDYNDYVYLNYPAAKPQHVVNPYQAYSYETMMKNAEQLRKMYPEIVKLSSIGKSVENRDLLLIEFGRGEKKIFVCGTHHAREYISTTYLMYAMDRYAYAYKNNTKWNGYDTRNILDNVTFCIVPMVNPDGVNLVLNGPQATTQAAELANMKIYDSPQYGYTAWKANIRGVDVNWNYDQDWTIEKNKNDRGSAGFNGDEPNTEPETIAISNYVDANYFEMYLSMHTQGQIFYWADVQQPSAIYNVVKKSTGFTGYEEKATGFGGSFFDYVFRRFQKPTVTIELCPYVGNYPYPDSKFDIVWNPVKNVLLALGNEFIK